MRYCFQRGGTWSAVVRGARRKHVFLEVFLFSDGAFSSYAAYLYGLQLVSREEMGPL